MIFDRCVVNLYPFDKERARYGPIGAIDVVRPFMDRLIRTIERQK